MFSSRVSNLLAKLKLFEFIDQRLYPQYSVYTVTNWLRLRDNSNVSKLFIVLHVVIPPKSLFKP